MVGVRILLLNDIFLSLNSVKTFRKNSNKIISENKFKKKKEVVDENAKLVLLVISNKIKYLSPIT